MRPQDYPNVLAIDLEIQSVTDEAKGCFEDKKRYFELLQKRTELREKRQKQIDFNIANETKP
jgi:hypothetical protein